MRRQRAPYAKRSVWYAVAILAFIVVVGFAGTGYELNHLRTEVNSLNVTVNSLKATIYSLVIELSALSRGLK